MRRFRSHLLPILFLALAAALVPASASAAEVRQGNTIVVASGETINDDLYAFGGTLDVQGTVNGDVIFFGGTSTIGGVITGDLLVAGGTTTINGDVRGNVRATGGTTNVAGRVGGDLVLAGGTLNVAPGASLGRDVLAAVGSASIGAPIARNVTIGSGDVTLAGPVGGDVRAEAGTLRLPSGAAVKGKLAYASDRPAEIASGVAVGGGIQRGDLAYGRDFWAPLSGGSGMAGIGALVWLRGLVGIFLLGLALVLFVPASVRRGTAALNGNLGASLGYGVLLLICIPILAILVFAIGLLIGGWWLGLALIFLYALALGVGFVVSAVLVRDLIVARLRPAMAHPVWSLLVGVLAFGILALVPVVGGIASSLAITAGLGALGRVLMSGSREQRRPLVAPTVTGPVIPVPSPA